ncbi:hypothetical protein H6A12_04115 [Phocea massiliensis]|uniref:Uncharacterized protein n=1 Tax=Merdimmobilis hominis TaxID=2897707 RepID=A0A938X411_9FIRM|nr:hypothetical protein [Merdimmobilis hominis]MBM6920342.1 hypothetical protein [Merdimmobilis hominis]
MNLRAWIKAKRFILAVIAALVVGFILGGGFFVTLSAVSAPGPMHIDDLTALARNIANQYKEKNIVTDPQLLTAPAYTSLFTNTFGANGKVYEYSCGLQSADGEVVHIFSKLTGIDADGDDIVDVLEFSFTPASSNPRISNTSHDLARWLIESFSSLDANELWTPGKYAPNWEISEPVSSDLYNGTAHSLLKTNADSCVLLYETLSDTSETVIMICLTPGKLLTIADFSSFTP